MYTFRRAGGRLTDRAGGRIGRWTGAAGGLPPGATRAQVELGAAVFHGKGGATCTACHGFKAEGTDLAASLTGRDGLWGDGDYPDIERIVKNGVPRPKKHQAPMPSMGGAQLSGEQVSAVAACVWAISHR